MIAIIIPFRIHKDGKVYKLVSYFVNSADSSFNTALLGRTVVKQVNLYKFVILVWFRKPNKTASTLSLLPP